ncbi:MAG TPA: DOMON-like domain-containing protein [Burkholderiales bacterium]|nr:DOMON-like domain-containing protein [Burkholderiales bacterium]
MPELLRHPDTPSRAVQAVTAQASRTAEGKLALGYIVRGDIRALRIPAPGPARIGWKLWRHTCCEVFLREKGANAYREFNFSPSGEWAAYAFTKYRDGGPLADESMNPQIAVRSDEKQLELSALLDLARISPTYPRASLALALSVVVEEESGVLSYWALRHAPGKPDFHHADALALELA